MDTVFVVAALASAILHAGWNAAVRSRARPNEAMTAQMVLAALMMLPLLAWSGFPPWSAWPWIILSTAANTLAIKAMLRAYELAPFGMVYPIGRTLSVMMVAPGTALILGERISLYGVLGIAMIAISLGFIAFNNASSNTAGKARIQPSGWLWIAVLGMASATCVIIEGIGVRTAGSAIAYGTMTASLNALVMIWRQRKAGFTVASLRPEVIAMIPVALASTISYALILWVFSRAPIAPAAALRDTSAVFAILIAVLWLKEPITRARLAAVLLAAAAVPLLRLG